MTQTVLNNCDGDTGVMPQKVALDIRIVPYKNHLCLRTSDEGLVVTPPSKAKSKCSGYQYSEIQKFSDSRHTSHLVEVSDWLETGD